MAEPESHDALSLERVVFFSDAVFAIAITLLVLEIKVPQVGHNATEAQLLNAVGALIPRFIGFLISFLVIGSMWVEHHRVFRYVARWDAGLLWKNLFFLLGIAFMPFPTALYSEYWLLRGPFVLYALALVAVGLGKIWVWRHVRDRGLLLPAIGADTIRSISRRSWAVPIVCAGLAVAAALGVPYAFAGFGLIAPVAMLLDRKRPAARPLPSVAEA